MTKIAVIGGGAAGLMAATRLVELSDKHEVHLLERNKILGQKVIISGGGRCNVTTGQQDLKEILKHYPRGASFLRTALYAFPPWDMMQWMQNHGVPLKVEADLRVFPKSNNGQHVVRAFENVLREKRVHLHLGQALKAIEKKSNLFQLQLESGESLKMDRVILCAGGQAYRHTGSKGDGYSFAEALGHHITALGPSLNAFLVEEAWIKSLAGLSFKNVALSFKGQNKFNFQGPILFTHKGVTGPGVFALSALAAYETFQKNKAAHLFLDFFPDKNHALLKEQFEAEFRAHPKKTLKNILSHLLPKSFSEALCIHLKVDLTKSSAELSKKDLNRLLDALKHLPLTLIGRSAGDEFVTAGGVELSEVDPKTMESKLCAGLYFAGEILNYDGLTGGYNLQAAWATGRLAGESLLKSC